MKPNLDRLRRQVMSEREADEAVRYVEHLQSEVERLTDANKNLCNHVREATGPLVRRRLN